MRCNKVKPWCYVIDGEVIKGTLIIEKDVDGDDVNVYRTADGLVVNPADYDEEVCVDCGDTKPVSICNLKSLSQSIAIAINEATPEPIDYTPLLESIIEELQGVDENTDEIEAKLDAVVSSIDAGTANSAASVTLLGDAIDELESLNTDTTAIVASLGTVISNLEKIDANTDELESLLASVLEEVKRGESCDNPVNVNVCETEGKAHKVEHKRLGRDTQINAPYQSVTVTALADDVTLDGIQLPEGMSITVEAAYPNYIGTTSMVKGSDFLITTVGV